MAKMTKKANEDGSAELQIMKIRTGRATFCVLGTSQLVFNAMSEKARQTLLLPGPKMTDADKQQNLKHHPLNEYRSSVYAHRGDDKPTRLLFPCGAFKKAMSTAALELPGIRKTQIARLIWMQDEDIDIYGVPQLRMDVVRMADMSHTPDIRSRATLPTWACRVVINFVQPQLSIEKIGALLASAGVLVGVGDGRQEKGAKNWGQFEIVAEDDPRFVALVKNAGRKAQDNALREPVLYDLEAERLFAWFNDEIKRRGEMNKMPAEAASGATRKKRDAIVPKSTNGAQHHEVA